MAVTAASAVAGGVQENNAAKANAKAVLAQGRQEANAANAQASNIRYEAGRSGGEILAKQGASGVDVASGSAADVGAENQQNYELDALRAIYGGQEAMRRAFDQSKMLKYQGKVAQTKAIISAGMGLANGAVSGGLFKPSSAGALNASQLTQSPAAAAFSPGKPVGYYVRS